MSGNGSEAGLWSGTDPWAESANRVRAAIVHGQWIRYFSVQSATPVVIVVVGLLVMLAHLGRAWTMVTVVQASLMAAAFVIAGVSYVSAQRTKSLLPQFPAARADRLLVGLSREQTRALGRQVRGSEAPGFESAQLVRALIDLGRKRNRGALGSLIAFFLLLAGVALGLSVVLLVFVLIVAAFMVVMTSFESRRWKRALRNVAALNREDVQS